ncbi:oxidoreductase [Fusarium phyllophilum]|uniref:Oxidoreductase n=1 Tax=Fusarium phyllophilum TaxID=47803 RepID=A0A8H5N7A3_9HYPO|nr:oxidoreductase [Fusarium phyllophilum]
MIEHYPSQALLGLTLAIATILLLTWAHWRSRLTLPLPPGPPSEFLLGHSRVIPKENAAAVYAKWSKEYSRLAAAIVLQVSYGTQVLEDDDPYIQIANDAMYATGNGGVPANSIVDLVPFVRYLPDCIVRDWSLRFARQWRWAIKKLHDVPFAAAQAEYHRYDPHRNTSLAHHLLREYKDKESRGQEQQWSLDDIKGAAGAVFIAGADTTWATCVIFILNMVLHPEIQEKAQQELDAVIGSDRLPDFSDRPALVYIEHIVQEIYRWSPLAPLGIPHKSLHDDIYNGMLIPKG